MSTMQQDCATNSVPKSRRTRICTISVRANQRMLGLERPENANFRNKTYLRRVGLSNFLAFTIEESSLGNPLIAFDAIFKR